MRIIAKRQILRNLGDGKNLTMPVPGPVADSAGKRPTQIVLIVILAVLAFITEFGFIARPKAVGTTHFRFESIQNRGSHTHPNEDSR